MSTHTDEKVERAIKEVRNIYSFFSILSLRPPIIIGYSGGKDSTAVVELFMHAFYDYTDIDNIYVVSTNTLVENPFTVEFLNKAHSLFSEYMPSFRFKILKPELHESFWVYLIGRGYAAPWRLFRWCTPRLKIKPITEFAKSLNARPLIFALGNRFDESTSRRMSMKTRGVDQATGLGKHSQLKNAMIYAPIRTWTIDDVWNFLLTHELNQKEPFRSINLELAQMYKDSADVMECGLQIERGMSTCGGSRFGCYTCTLVQNDRSLTNLRDSGKTWLTPLLQLRHFLLMTQNPEIKPYIRERKILKNGKPTYSKYTLEFCKLLLDMVLAVQEEVRKYKPDFTVISDEEIRIIKDIWKKREKVGRVGRHGYRYH